MMRLDELASQPSSRRVSFLRFAWRLIWLVLHRYYPPRIFIFSPLYRLLRRRLRIPMSLSNLLVWWTSALLHGAVLAIGGLPIAAVVFAGIFVVLGLASTIVVIFSKRTCQQVVRRASGCAKHRTLD